MSVPVSAVTFDCYGTLVQWPERQEELLGAIAGRHGITTPPGELRARFREHQYELTTGPYRRYADVLADGLTATLAAEGITATDDDRRSFVNGLSDVPPYPEVPDVLREVARRRRVVLISNTDDNLVAATIRGLGDGVHDVITAEQAGAYKPALAIFALAHERAGAPPGEIVHVGASGSLDMVPARTLGLRRVWVDRRNAGTVDGEPTLRLTTLDELPAALDALEAAA